MLTKAETVELLSVYAMTKRQFIRKNARRQPISFFLSYVQYRSPLRVS